MHVKSKFSLRVIYIFVCMYLLKVNFVIFDRKYMVSYSNLCWYSFPFFFFFLEEMVFVSLILYILSSC